jgi:hypothetical protein
MDQDTQQAVGVWAVFAFPSLRFGSFLYARKQLTPEVVGMCWFPAIVLTTIGGVLPPWKPPVS